MKVKVEPWRLLFRGIDDAIQHSDKEGLPLSGIELNESEWELFIDSIAQFKVARSRLDRPQLTLDKAKQLGKIWYMRTKIYRGRE